MNKLGEYAIVLFAAFLIPSLAVANKWGTMETQQEQANQNMKEMMEKIDKVYDEVVETKGRVIRLETLNEKR